MLLRFIACFTTGRLKDIGAIFALGVFAVGCSSISKWESRFTEEEKIQIIYNRGVSAFEKGKETFEHQSLQKAKADFEFLLENYKHQPSKDKLAEIERFYRETKQALQNGVADAKAKNDFLAQVGFYRKLQRLAPADSEASRFLRNNESDIRARVEQNLSAGKSALAAKDYQRAVVAFSAVLSAYPESQEAQRGLSDAKTGYDEAKRLEAEEAARRAAEEAARARRRAALRDKDDKEQPPQLSAGEKEKLYQAGKAAFDKKDFLAAYKSFMAIGDENYKDVRIYLQRSLSKVKALKLEK